MRTHRLFARLALIVAIGMVGVPLNAYAFDPQPEPPIPAQASKLKAAGSEAKCQLNVMAKALVRGVDPQSGDDYLKCGIKFGVAVGKAEAKCAATGWICPQGDAAIIGPLLDAMSANINGFLVQEIAAAPRFLDLGDGTVKDTKTGLQWEKKNDLDDIQDYTNPHDADNLYAWSYEEPAPGPPNGPLFTEFLYILNNGQSVDGAATTGCFAGHCDWRLPTVEELQTILLEPYPCPAAANPAVPCIDPVFYPELLGDYWSATTDANNSAAAWRVSFDNGFVGVNGKQNTQYVRAVRTGS